MAAAEDASVTHRQQLEAADRDRCFEVQWLETVLVDAKAEIGKLKGKLGERDEQIQQVEKSFARQLQQVAMAADTRIASAEDSGRRESAAVNACGQRPYNPIATRI
jgi:hypothetical protein